MCWWIIVFEFLNLKMFELRLVLAIICSCFINIFNLIRLVLTFRQLEYLIFLLFSIQFSFHSTQLTFYLIKKIFNCRMVRLILVNVLLWSSGVKTPLLFKSQSDTCASTALASLLKKKRKLKQLSKEKYLLSKNETIAESVKSEVRDFELNF